MPNRILKESICTSDSIDSLSWFEEVLFYRLIVTCDDFGRFDGRTAVIKNRLFPLKDSLTLGTVKAAIQKLVSAGLVITYESMGKPYLYLPTWTAHQTARAKKSKYPAPDSGNITSAVDVKSSEIICKQMQADDPVFDIRESNSVFDIRESKGGNDAHTRAGDSAVAAVFSAYEEKISRQMTEGIRDGLMTFLSVMGPECCIRAMDAAIEAGKVSWYYVRSVLEAKRAQGVRSLADWDAAEARREGERHGKIQPAAGAGGETFKGWRAKSALDDAPGVGAQEDG